MTHLPTLDATVMRDLLSVLTSGDLRIAHRALDGLVSEYDPTTGLIVLNPDASADEQAAALTEHLRSMAAWSCPADVVVRPSLRLIRGGRS